MASQNANAVAITGGTVSGATITGTGLPTGCAQVPCVVASVATATYTAGGTELSLYTSTATGNYCLTMNVITTTAGTGGTGTVTPYAKYTGPSSEPNGSYVALGSVDLASAGATNTYPGGANVACFISGSGQHINYQFAVVTSGLTGYTYTASAQVTYMGP
jgi:hypothetical protein